MIVFLYRWRVKPGREAQFVEAWSEITAFYREKFDSRGSRLHRGDDGLFYGYAQWASLEHRAEAFADVSKAEAGARLRAAIEESFPETRLDILADFLVGEKNC